MKGELLVCYLPLYGAAAKITIAVSVGGIVVSLCIGLVCAVIRMWRVPLVSLSR